MHKTIKPYINTIIQDDNIKTMKKMPDNSLDVIFADPPYNMQLEKQLIRYNGTEFSGVNDDWDKFASLEAYDKFSKKWISESLRLLKKDGSLWVMGSFHNIHRIGTILQNMGCWIINEITWVKSNPVPNFMGTRFVNAHETLLWVTKSKDSKFTFNYKTMKKLNGGKQMKSTWTFSTSIGGERLKDSAGKKVHSTQKPLKLLERVILASSKIGDCVMDPFSGTGTTAHAAKLHGRNYIGIENNKKYVQASLERLNNVKENINNYSKAVYDIKPPKVTYYDLLHSGYITTTTKLKIYNSTYKLNKLAFIEHEGSLLTPNALCKVIYGGPTNSWDKIIVDDYPISLIRDKYRVENLNWKPQ